MQTQAKLLQKKAIEKLSIDSMEQIVKEITNKEKVGLAINLKEIFLFLSNFPKEPSDEKLSPSTAGKSADDKSVVKTYEKKIEDLTEDTITLEEDETPPTIEEIAYALNDPEITNLSSENQFLEIEAFKKLAEEFGTKVEIDTPRKQQYAVYILSCCKQQAQEIDQIREIFEKLYPIYFKSHHGNKLIPILQKQLSSANEKDTNILLRDYDKNLMNPVIKSLILRIAEEVLTENVILEIYQKDLKEEPAVQTDKSVLKKEVKQVATTISASEEKLRKVAVELLTEDEAKKYLDELKNNDLDVTELFYFLEYIIKKSEGKLDITPMRYKEYCETRNQFSLEKQAKLFFFLYGENTPIGQRNIDFLELIIKNQQSNVYFGSYEENLHDPLIKNIILELAVRNLNKNEYDIIKKYKENIIQNLEILDSQEFKIDFAQHEQFRLEHYQDIQKLQEENRNANLPLSELIKAQTEINKAAKDLEPRIKILEERSNAQNHIFANEINKIRQEFNTLQAQLNENNISDEEQKEKKIQAEDLKSKVEKLDQSQADKSYIELKKEFENDEKEIHQFIDKRNDAIKKEMENFIQNQSGEFFLKREFAKNAIQNKLAALKKESADAIQEKIKAMHEKFNSKLKELFTPPKTIALQQQQKLINKHILNLKDTHETLVKLNNQREQLQIRINELENAMLKKEEVKQSVTETVRKESHEEEHEEEPELFDKVSLQTGYIPSQKSEKGFMPAPHKLKSIPEKNSFSPLVKHKIKKDQSYLLANEEVKQSVTETVRKESHEEEHEEEPELFDKVSLQTGYIPSQKSEKGFMSAPLKLKSYPEKNSFGTMVKHKIKKDQSYLLASAIPEDIDSQSVVQSLTLSEKEKYAADLASQWKMVLRLAQTAMPDDKETPKFKQGFFARLFSYKTTLEKKNEKITNQFIKDLQQSPKMPPKQLAQLAKDFFIATGRKNAIIHGINIKTDPNKLDERTKKLLSSNPFIRDDFVIAASIFIRDASFLQDAYKTIMNHFKEYKLEDSFKPIEAKTSDSDTSELNSQKIKELAVLRQISTIQADQKRLLFIAKVLAERIALIKNPHLKLEQLQTTPMNPKRRTQTLMEYWYFSLVQVRLASFHTTYYIAKLIVNDWYDLQQISNEGEQKNIDSERDKILSDLSKIYNSNTPNISNKIIEFLNSFMEMLNFGIQFQPKENGLIGMQFTSPIEQARLMALAQAKMSLNNLNDDEPHAALRKNEIKQFIKDILKLDFKLQEHRDQFAKCYKDFSNPKFAPHVAHNPMLFGNKFRVISDEKKSTLVKSKTAHRL